ncbi:MAG: endoribonuclease MazF [Pseudomonadota bacterium]|nr:endoribonuclease MazF [Pseudomonadota bacterium]
MVKSASLRGAYIPERGDLIWLLFDPQAGQEQAGRRPALVISPKSYNAASNLALFCPITSRVKGYPFEIVLPANSKVTGAILSDQIKSLDWKARKAKLITKTAPEIIAEVLGKIGTLTG